MLFVFVIYVACFLILRDIFFPRVSASPLPFFTESFCSVYFVIGNASHCCH